MNIYLDQNVLGHASVGRYKLPTKREIIWIYSTEHFNEISRGDKVQLRAFLQSIRARRIEVVTDKKGRITDQFKICPYENPRLLFERYVQHIKSLGVDLSVFNSVISACFGSQDELALGEYPRQLGEMLRAPLKGVADLDELLGERLEKFGRYIGESTIKSLSSTRPLEKQRKPLGFDKGRASKLAEGANPLCDLWDHANRHYPATISRDKFFGFEPILDLGYDRWPEFLGIVSCYTLLNAIGFFPDKGLANPSRVPANSSDGNHVAYAAFCDGLISADTRLCVKARAIYLYRGIGTRVFDVSELIDK